MGCQKRNRSAGSGNFYRAFSEVAAVLLFLILILLLLFVRITAGQDACAASGTICNRNAGACTEQDVNCGGCCDEAPCNGNSECCPCKGPGTFPPTGDPFVPLTSVNDNAYLGEYPLGLYVDRVSFQSNEIPSQHFTKALKRAGDIIPRDDDGLFDPVDGRIGVVGIGMSVVRQEFGQLITEIGALPAGLDGLNDRLVFVNGGVGSQTPLCDWAKSAAEVEIEKGDSSSTWGNLFITALENGKTPGADNDNDNTNGSIPVDPDQVQVIWVKMVNGQPWSHCQDEGSGCVTGGCTDNLCGEPPVNDNSQGCRFPAWVFAEDGEVEKYKIVLQRFREQFPNLKLVLFTSRAYGGYAVEVDPTEANECVPKPCGEGNPEPWAYENGFTVQELMRLQIFESDPDKKLDYSATGAYPLILWGPYIWSNGATPNDVVLDYESEGMAWECHHACADGQHPSAAGMPGIPAGDSGQEKVAALLDSYFRTEDVTEPWYMEHPLIMSSFPPNGWLDAREDRDAATGTHPEGLTQITITFDKPVRDANNEGPLTVDSFEITSTGPVTPPAIDSVTNPSGNDYVITLHSPILPGEWTTIRALVEDTSNHAIRGDPWDRVDLAFLPGDCNANGTTNSDDHDLIVTWLTTGPTPPAQLGDINRSGTFTGADKTRLEQLFVGTKSSRAWNNISLPSRP